MVDILEETTYPSPIEKNYSIVMNRELQIELLSQDIHELFSFYTRDINGKPYWLPFSEAVNTKLKWIVSRWISNRTNKVLHVVTRNNNLVSLSTSIYQVSAESGELKYIIHLIDTNTELGLRRQIKELKGELEMLVYQSAHYLRGPLVSVLGCLQLIELEQEEPSEYLSLMEEVLKKMDYNLQEITRQVFSRNNKLQIKPLLIESIVDEIINHFKDYEHYDTTSLKLRIEGNHPFHSDEILFKMILTNLLSNAFRFFDSKSPNHLIEVTIAIEPDRLVLNVDDEGIGIPSEYHAKIYDMFFRATTSSNGVGLGLYMVKNAVDNLQGNISFTSVPGRGTQFKVVLPNAYR